MRVSWAFGAFPGKCSRGDRAPVKRKVGCSVLPDYLGTRGTSQSPPVGHHRRIAAVSPTIINWVERYVPAQIRAGKYLPHLTVGTAKFDDLKIIEAEPFDAFTVSTIPDFSRLPGRFALLRAAGSRILRLR